MKHGLSVMASPDSPLAPSGGPNGAGTPPVAEDPRAVLAAMVAQREMATAPEATVSQTAAAEVAPEESATEAAQGEPGEEILTPPETESQEATEAELPKEATSDETDEASNEAGTGPTPPEWAKLSPTERKSALELAKTFKPGEIPRIAKLVALKHQLDQTIEAQQQQIEELTEAVASGANNPTASAAGANPLPEPVAKLKTVAEVQERLEKVQGDAEALTDFLDANPGDATTTYQLGEQEFTRQQLIERRAALRQEAKILPKRAQQITTVAQREVERKQINAQLAAKFPVYQDAEHPDTKRAREFAKQPEFAGRADGDFLAFALARGLRELEAEVKARSKPKVVAKPAGSIPTGKPHSAGGSAGAKAPTASAAAAMSRNQKEGSKGSFAALLAATGR